MIEIILGLVLRLKHVVFFQGRIYKKEEWRVVKIFSKEGSLDVTFRNFGDIKSKTLPGWYSGYRYTESIDLQLYFSFRGKSFIKATIIESENY